MSFTPPPAPTLARKPFDLSKLSPEDMARLQNEGSLTFEDGSAIYPDGTYSGAGDSPNDFAGGGFAPQSAGLAMGGLGGPPPAPDPALGGAAPATDPFASPQFDRYFSTANAPFPGTPGGVGGGPAAPPNPMLEPLDPFATAPEAEAAQPFLLGAGPTVTPPADAVAARRQMGGAQPATPKTPAYGGRYGRRQVSRTATRR